VKQIGNNLTLVSELFSNYRARGPAFDEMISDEGVRAAYSAALRQLGKLEADESVADALARELHEELGLVIAPSDVQAWREQLVDYPHALVRLHFCKVHAWRGDLQMREGQSFTWSGLPVQVAPVLPGALPVLEWLQAERLLLDK